LFLPKNVLDLHNKTKGYSGDKPKYLKVVEKLIP